MRPGPPVQGFCPSGANALMYNECCTMNETQSATLALSIPALYVCTAGAMEIMLRAQAQDCTGMLAEALLSVLGHFHSSRTGRLQLSQRNARAF